MRKLIIAAERDMRWDDRVLPRVKSLPNWLDNSTLIGRQKEGELSSHG